MQDYQAFRHGAIRYWERRRILYNIALVPPSLCSFMFIDLINYPDGPHAIPYACVIPLFALSAVGANVCFTFAYALEFLCGRGNSDSHWIRQGRTMVFVSGVLFAMLLALIGGRNIAEIAYHYEVTHH